MAGLEPLTALAFFLRPMHASRRSSSFGSIVERARRTSALNCSRPSAIHLAIFAWCLLNTTNISIPVNHLIIIPT